MLIHHLGIAVQSLASTVSLWERTVGATATASEEVPSQRVRVVFLEVGSNHLELLEPTDPDSPVGRFLASRGEGIHHVAFRVQSVNEKLAELEARGLRVIDHVARPGARGLRVGFAHPNAFHGVLVEFVEVP